MEYLISGESCLFETREYYVNVNNLSSYCTGIWNYNLLVRKRTHNHLVKLVMSDMIRIYN